MRIHPVVLITQLEPAPPHDIDPYNRQPDVNPPPVKNENFDTLNANITPSYKVERLLDKRTQRYGRGRPTVKYLVK